MTSCISPYYALLAFNDDMHLINEGAMTSFIFVFNMALRRRRGVLALLPLAA